MNQLLRKYKSLFFFVALTAITGSSIAQTVSSSDTLRPPVNILTLEQSRQAATSNNRKILIQKDSIQIAKLGIDRAKTGALPTVDGSGNVIHFGHPLNKILPKFTESASGTGSEVIYNGGKVRNSVKLAQVVSDVQYLTLNKTRADIIVSTDSTYWQIVYMKQEIATYLQSRQYLSSALKDIKSRYNAGENFKNDVLQVEIQYNNNELKLLRVRDSMEVAKLNLLQLTGYPINMDFDVPDSVSYNPVLLTADCSYDSSVNNRPETQILQKQVETADLQTKLSFSQMLPKVSVMAMGIVSHSGEPGFEKLIGSINNGTPIVSGGGSTDQTWLALLTVSVPIFHWGDYKKQVTQYKLRADATRYQYADQKEKLLLELRQSWYAIKEAEMNVQLSDVTLAQATENLRLATKRLQAGTILVTDWLQAQSTWQQSYSQAIQARVLYNVSITRFQKATGELQ